MREWKYELEYILEIKIKKINGYIHTDYFVR